MAGQENRDWLWIYFAIFSAVFCCLVIRGLGASVLNVKPDSFPLPRSLSRYAPAVRLRRAAGACVQKLEKTEQSRDGERPRRCRFSIGSAPLTSITESDAQISGGETRQDYKDTRRFPLVAPSCALLFLPFGLPVSIRCYGRVYLIPRLTLSSGKAVRSKLDCMHEPPVQSDCCACSGNYRLESNPERHDKTPLAAAIGIWFTERRGVYKHTQSS